MKVAYFDASAIVKLAHLERESQALLDYLGEAVEASTSVISDVEVLRALRRLQTPKADVGEAMRGFYVLNLDPDIRQEAARIGSDSLRSLDAIHLATALSLRDDDLDFVTYDDRLAIAAREYGLRVVQPGRPAGSEK